MIGKLFKYDFKALMRLLLPVYAALLLSSVFTGISLRNAAEYSEANGDSLFRGLMVGNVSTSDTIAGTLIFVYIILIIAAALLTAILVMVRFYKNLIDNEGYMMFAVPVKTSTHIFEKLLSALVWAVIGGLSILLSMFLMAFIVSDVSMSEIIDGIISGLKSIINANLLDDVFLWLGIFILGTIMGIMKIYGVIAIGQQWSNHKILGAFLAYIVASVIENIVSRIFLIGVLYNSMMYNQELRMTSLYLPTYIVVVCCIAAYSLITWFLLDRKLNLE